MQPITFADFSRVKGVSRPAVTSAINSGRIADAVIEIDGKRMLDKRLAMTLWDKNTRETHNAKRRKSAVEIPIEETPARLRDAINELPDDQIPDLNESRARKEHYQSELAKLQVLQQRELLVPAEQISKDAFNVGRSIRETLTNIADRLSNQLAGETDPRMIHRMLTEEHRHALNQLADGQA